MVSCKHLGLPQPLWRCQDQRDTQSQQMTSGRSVECAARCQAEEHREGASMRVDVYVKIVGRVGVAVSQAGLIPGGGLRARHRRHKGGAALLTG